MRQQLLDLREKMSDNSIDVYLIPTTDYHGSEYVNDYFKCRKFVSGFTGSAGTLIVTADEARLWTDGRYFIQAAHQLAGSGIELMKMGEEGVPTIEEYLETAVKPGMTLGFDGRVIDYAFGKALSEKYSVRYDLDLVDLIWEDRPEIVPSEIHPLPQSVTGESVDSKLARIRSYMEAMDVNYHLVTKLDDIAWIFNLRADDVDYTPVFYSYALITKDYAFLYPMNKDFKGSSSENYIVKPYEKVFEDLSNLSHGSIILDEAVANYAIVKSISSHVSIVDNSNPSELMKAIKNTTELACTKKAHIRDGVAMVQFIYWLKKHMANADYGKDGNVLTEIKASDYLLECRKSQEGFNDLSFETISGYGSNGAIVHYAATPETDKELKPEGFLLVDSGGQYSDGTTDITRTIALGPLSEKMQEDYTTVLKSHIALARCEFPAKTTDVELDAIAREPMLAKGMNYNHGTGHGVGHLLSVHEEPQWLSPRGSNKPLYPGMVTSNEPGYYLEGEYGIRLENEIVCHNTGSNIYAFETITFCPFDKEAIIPEMLSDEELNWLNKYHQTVYNTISPLVSEDIKLWLAEETSEL